jgi:ribosomal silencing factor RsfS
LDNRGGILIGALDSPDFSDNFSFFILFSTTIFKQVMSIRVLVKNEAKRKKSHFSVFAFRDSIPVFKYAPKTNKEY